MGDNNPKEFILDGYPGSSISASTGSSVALAIIESRKDIPIFYPERTEREED